MIKNSRIRIKIAALYIEIFVFTLILIVGIGMLLYLLSTGFLTLNTTLLIACGLFCVIYIIAYALITFFIGRSLAKYIAYPVAELRDVTKVMTSGNFDVPIMVSSEDEIGELANELRELIIIMKENSFIIERNSALIYRIKECAASVSACSNDIASRAQDLTKKFGDDTRTIERLGSEINKVRELAGQNTDTANELLNDSRENSRITNNNAAGMQHINKTVHLITESSKQLSEAVGALDNITFKLKILSLNTAIEASKIGHPGKGFAIIADEMRDLAARSEKAAREANELIKSGIQIAMKSSEIASEANASVDELCIIAEKNADNMNKLSAASVRQNASISDINREINKINNTMNANSDTASDNASAAQNTRTQVDLLNQTIGEFIIRKK